MRLGAQQAMSRSAYLEARDQLAAALDLLSRQPDSIERDRTEIAVRINLALCTTFVISDGLASTAVSDILEGARDLCQKIGDDARLFEVLENLSFQFSGQFELAKARTLGNELLRIALRTQIPKWSDARASILDALRCGWEILSPLARSSIRPPSCRSRACSKKRLRSATGRSATARSHR